MRNAAVSDMKDALIAIRREEQREEERPSDNVAVKQEAFRKGVATRLKAVDVLAPHGPQQLTFARLDTPFLIWAFRNGGPTSILTETHIEPLDNWARFRSEWEFAGHFTERRDDVIFYFLWQNDSGSDAVVNVEAHLMMTGWIGTFARSGFISLPFWGWGQGTTGWSNVTVSANLALREWWNQPPTEPLRQPSQRAEAVNLSVSGGWTPVSWNGNGEAKFLADSYHVHYDRFFVPIGAVAVFEVFFRMTYGGFKASGDANFQDAPLQVLCPYLELEILTPR